MCPDMTLAAMLVPFIHVLAISVFSPRIVLCCKLSVGMQHVYVCKLHSLLTGMLFQCVGVPWQ